MGRLFSTLYRVVLVGVSVSALVFSVLSATSCAFVKFDHQYKSEGRRLSEYDVDGAARTAGGGGRERALQTLGETGPSVGDVIDDVANFTVDVGDAVDAVANITADPTAEDDPTAEAEETAEADPTAETDPTAEAEVTAEADALAAEGTEALAASQAEDNATDTTEVPEDTAAPVAAPESGGDVPAPGQDADPGQISDAAGPEGPDDSEPSDADPAPEEGQDYGPVDEPEGYGPEPTAGDEDGPAPASESSAAADGASQAAATASGDAGLYCDGARSFSVTNLWGQSAQQLKDDLASVSDQNQSEELARGAAVAAGVFGLVTAFVLVAESVIGWRMCCERWIVGAAALCASVSQGVTFLFFNSERYCDGDIVHEILNQEPCVLGRGAWQSIVAIVLYALAMVMACRLPQDDPYGFCCKERSAARNRDGARGGAAGGSKFGLLGKGGSDVGSPETADGGGSERRGERPNWLPEDKDREENEII